MATEINIEEVKNNAIHSELLKAMCLISQARNIVSDAMDEKELRDLLLLNLRMLRKRAGKNSIVIKLGKRKYI